MAAPSVHAQFFHSSDDVVPSARKRGAFERPSDGPGCQRSGNFSYVALNCFDYTHRDSAATDETRSDGKKGLHEYSGATYVHENCDDSLFDSLDCLGDEFLGSSAADLSFSYLPVSPSNDVFVNHQDNFETRRPNGKGGLTPLLMKSANSSHADDNDEIHFGHSTFAAIPEVGGQSRQLGAQVQQCHSTPSRCDLNMSFTTDGTCSPAQSPIGGLELNGFWEATHKTDDPEIQRRPRELSQESDVSVIMKLSPVKTEAPSNLSALAAKPEQQQHAIGGPVNGEICRNGTLPRDLGLVMSMMQQDTKTAALDAQRPAAAQADESASVAELLDLPDLIQPTDASSERCKSSIQSVLGKRKLDPTSLSSSLSAPIGSFTTSRFSLETVVVQSIQYGLDKDTATQSLKSGQSVAKRQEALKAEVEELEADNVLLHGCLKELSSLVKGVWDQNRRIQRGLASSGIARSPLDMTLYMTATAASNKDIENKLNGKLESGTMSMELLFNKLSGSGKGLLP